VHIVEPGHSGLALHIEEDSLQLPQDDAAVSATAPLARLRLAVWPELRALAWDGDLLYASRQYDLLCARPDSQRAVWSRVASFRPALWRRVTAQHHLSARAARDGFHGLVTLPSGAQIATVPGAIVRRSVQDDEFVVCHRVRRGTRPLGLTALPDGTVCWGEYFDNPLRAEVHVYASSDDGRTWHVAYTFPAGSIRHVHNIVFDPWARSLWVLTGDVGRECRILRASCDWTEVQEVLGGNQQARAVAAIPREDALFFASDTPLERNYVYRLDRRGGVDRLAPLEGSVFYGCQAGDGIFFSTAVEPSQVNRSRQVTVCGSRDGESWQQVLAWTKDRWSMRFFQYGVGIMPSGSHPSLLAVSVIGVEEADGATSVWRVTERAAESGSAHAASRRTGTDT
jgi:hypothetical protein